MSQIDEVTRQLFQPLLEAIGKEREEEFWSILEAEASGVQSWGVRSGYFLWTRTHPGVIPTKEQARDWIHAKL